MKLGIGLPIIGHMGFNSFWITFTTIQKPDFTLFVPTLPGNEFPDNIAASRNGIVLQALENECTHLIMMDTDQGYPVDTITKLLSHEKDVVGVNIHRRYPPFEPIMMRGQEDEYYHVPDKECYSGDLIEVDATGCGCVCYNMDVFYEIEYPWYEWNARSKNGKPVGEDVLFCQKLKETGFSIYVDTSIEVDHFSMFAVNKAAYFMHKKVKGFEWAKPDFN